MCGIWGYFDKNGKYDAGSKRMAAYISKSRGEGGLGMLGFVGKRRLAWKDGVSIATFLKEGKYVVDPFARFDALLGHNRRPSTSIKGSAISKKNSHPFQVGHITMAHNGFISNYESIITELKKHEDYIEIADSISVDSHALCAALDKWGTKALTGVRGKAAVWWYDDRTPNNAYMWVWKQDLAMQWSEGVDGIVFASELEALQSSGFHKAIKLDEDCGQLLTIDVEKSMIVDTEDIKGDEPAVVVAPAVTTTHSSKNNYEYGCPQDVLEFFKDDRAAAQEIEEMFRMMQGQYVAYCPHCGKFLQDYDCSLVRINDKGEIDDKGFPSMLHMSYQSGCGNFVFPLTADHRAALVSDYIEECTPEARELLGKYWSSTSTKRQTSSLHVLQGMNKNKREELVLQVYCTDKDSLVELFKNDKPLFGRDGALVGINQTMVMNMWNRMKSSSEFGLD